MKQFLSLGLLSILSCTVNAAEPVDFEKQIRPLLLNHCVSCHGPTKQKAALRLDAKSFAFKGGNSGLVIVPAKSKDSELFRRVSSSDSDSRMPPGENSLTSTQIDLLKRWIDEGAKWEETQADRDVARDKRLDHWAWQPIAKTAVPTANDPAHRNEIDHFIAVKLKEKCLSFSPEADRKTLIRRLSFDLLGIPPTPEEVRDFVGDTHPLAYERLLDRLLASPRYGERWARHWLDIAHYADTHGFERDQRRDHAYRYRDWVIQSLNRDQPYDQFLRDQIAGDVLRPNDPDAVIATGFLAAGPWDFVGQAETPSPVLKRLARADDLDDMVTQVLTATCGVTINCARCHDHKLDPISQKEYYRLWSVFAGVKRGNRSVSLSEEKQIAESRVRLEREIRDTRLKLTGLRGTGWSLSDVVGGGDGTGTGKANAGIDPASGKVQTANRGFLENAPVNQFAKSIVKFVDGVIIPDGGESGKVTISSTGLVAKGIPRTGGKAWDAIRNGPVNSQFSTKLGDIDFAQGHSLLSLHANAGITFDLAEWRKNGLPAEVRLRASAGYFGQTPREGASFHVLLDGETKLERLKIGRDDGLIDIDLPIPQSVRFLTLLATDGGNDIAHDQICFGDARLEPAKTKIDDSTKLEADRLTKLLTKLQNELTSLVEPAKVYAAISETPPEIKLLARGNTEDPKDVVSPGSISCLTNLKADLGSNTLSDGERRIAFANWVTDERNPLTRRVIVNRMWHHHFGAGLVETPSDFGLGGGLPSHPELLNWLADRLLHEKWSLKAMHRIICLSRTYRQTSLSREEEKKLDSSNRLCWRQSPRRLDAESLRDSVLSVSGKLNLSMFGPGYRDFDYKEEYAPVYTYITADRPDLWRRSIYRFAVRTTPHQFLTTLDCPNPANLSPTRSVTTTALQSLALMNDDFMLKQAEYFAARVQSEVGEQREKQITRAFELAFSRVPTPDELKAAEPLVVRHGLSQLCRFLLNANEFVSVD